MYSTSYAGGGGVNQRNYAMLVEPRSILPQGCEFILANKDGFSKEFSAIFTHDEQILDALPNAKFKAGASIYCYIANNDPLWWSEDKYQIKSKDISMIVSGKEFTQLHLIRNAVAKYLAGNHRVDIFGKFVNRHIPYVSIALDEYRYNIAIENQQSAYYFTEKILDCFISMTIPIYLGATKIGEFFNKDGIIELKNGDNIDEVLKQCTKEEYESRLEAIKDNYQRALKYLNTSDMLYETYFKKS